MLGIRLFLSPPPTVVFWSLCWVCFVDIKQSDSYSHGFKRIQGTNPTPVNTDSSIRLKPGSSLCVKSPVRPCNVSCVRQRFCVLRAGPAQPGPNLFLIGRHEYLKFRAAAEFVDLLPLPLGGLKSLDLWIIFAFNALCLERCTPRSVQGTGHLDLDSKSPRTDLSKPSTQEFAHLFPARLFCLPLIELSEIGSFAPVNDLSP